MLEQMRGFFCHLGMTFPIIFPYLKGFHLTLCEHMHKRDEEGWKLSEMESIGQLELLREKGVLSGLEVEEHLGRLGVRGRSNPTVARLVPRFFICLKALSVLFQEEDPPKWSHRKSHLAMLIYGFHDASKSGLGITKSYENKLTVSIGTWGRDTEEESSNWREFSTLVEDMEKEEVTGNLNNAWVIMATDSSTVESCLYKGNSSSPKLFDLVVRLKSIEMRTGAHILPTHVSGERMKAQGTDGVS